MFEQDYVMRLIREMIRAVLLFVFHIDAVDPAEELLEEEEQSILEPLLDMVDRGDVNEAENRIYEMMAGSNRRDLKIALLFYAYLNEKGDCFLQEHGFSREEIRLGLERLLSGYGLEGVGELFLN